MQRLLVRKRRQEATNACRPDLLAPTKSETTTALHKNFAPQTTFLMTGVRKSNFGVKARTFTRAFFQVFSFFFCLKKTKMPTLCSM